MIGSSFSKKKNKSYVPVCRQVCWFFYKCLISTFSTSGNKSSTIIMFLIRQDASSWLTVWRHRVCTYVYNTHFLTVLFQWIPIDTSSRSSHVTYKTIQHPAPHTHTFYLPANLATWSASPLLLSALNMLVWPPWDEAAFPNLAKIIARLRGLTDGYDMERIEGSIYAWTASERIMLIV